MNTTPRYTIQVDIQIEYNPEVVSASEELSIKRKYKLDVLKQRMFNDIFDSVVETIESKSFDILEISHSHKGNSGYVTFYPVMVDGIKLDAVKIKFRISDHKSKSINKADKSPKVVRIVSFIITDHVFNNSLEFLLEIDDLCDELQQGNIDVLDDYVQETI